MKTLILMRHGDAPSTTLGDFERQLSQHGKLDAELTARYLSQNFRIDLIISSHASRAKDTASIIQAKFPSVDAVEDPIIYSGDFQKIFTFLSLVEDNYYVLCIVGHNPAILELARYLAIDPNNQELYNMPTAKAIIFELKIDSWRNLKPYNGELIAAFLPA